MAEKHSLIGGGTIEDVKQLSKIYKFPIYDISDEVSEVGVIISNNHCVVVLPRNDENLMFAE